MTTTIALSYNKRILFISDRQASGDHFKHVRKEPKVFRNNHLTIGWAGSFRVAQLLQYQLDVPNFYASDTPLEYMTNEFIPAVQKTFRENYWEVDDLENYLQGASLIVACKDKFFEVEEDLNVSEPELNYLAIGSGMKYAYGSLFTLHRWQSYNSMGPEDMLLEAMQTAHTFDPSTGKQWDIVEHNNE